MESLKQDYKLIHLLYVPTIYCNLNCSYCYLGDQINHGNVKKDAERAMDTLEFALKKFTDSNVIPFNLSLHGGEVTILPPETLGKLFGYITDHYNTYKTELTDAGFKKANPHLKTNLYNLHLLYDLFVENNVSVSASIDLPLSLHEKHRINKGGKSTLRQTLDNLKLLSEYPHGKKFSSVITLDHFHRIDEIIDDIWYIHKEVGFDMNRFNFMFGFESELNFEKHEDDTIIENITTLTTAQQVEFYEKIKKAFAGTELDKGLNTLWFEEFTPSFCTSAVNCGEKFFLLQGDGNVYSCVRGQGVEEFYYGNIFEDSVETILENGANKIKKIHNEYGLHDDCSSCSSLSLCNTGCPFVKHQQKSAKSYTCDLQRVLYKDLNFTDENVLNETISMDDYREEYLYHNYPHKVFEQGVMDEPEVLLNPEVEDLNNALINLIKEDELLQELYLNDNFTLILEGKEEPVYSQILRKSGQKHFISENSEVKLRLKRSVFEANSKEPIRSTLYMMMLRDNKVVYGDEKRTKQEHVFTHEVFSRMLVSGDELYAEYDLMPLLKLNKPNYMEGVCNNMFFTTNYLREYHYKKQKENAFYHIQALNLPFPNFEFFWID